MIGFGNPLLDGTGDPSDAAMDAPSARDNQRCPEAGDGKRRGTRRLRGVAARSKTRGGLADVALIRMQAPLPETADELCAVARDLRADRSEIRLGASATEREVKRLSEARPARAIPHRAFRHPWRAGGPDQRAMPSRACS